MMMDRFDLFAITFLDSRNTIIKICPPMSDCPWIRVPFQTLLSTENKFECGGGFTGFWHLIISFTCSMSSLNCKTSLKRNIDTTLHKDQIFLIQKLCKCYSTKVASQSRSARVIWIFIDPWLEVEIQNCKVIHYNDQFLIQTQLQTWKIYLSMGLKIIFLMCHNSATIVTR